MPRKGKTAASFEAEVPSDKPPSLTLSDWFDDHVTCADTVAKYSAAAPRGMNNPPMNPRVREKLFQDLMEYGIVHTQKWPPPKPLFQQVDHKTSLMSSKSPRRSTMPYHTHSLISLERQRATNADTVEKRPHLIRKKWLALDETPSGRRRANASLTKLGASDTSSSSRAAPRSVSEQALARPGSSAGKDVGRAALGSRGSSDPGRPASSERRGGIVLAAKTLQRNLEEKASNDAAGAAKGKAEKVLDDTQFRNGIDALRSRSRLHAAGVSDRHRFVGDLSAAGSMVLTGAGAAGGPQAGRWQSDASDLNVFHNSAMRTVNPSGLRERALELKRRKKREEDDLQLSESGLFVARYIGDPNVKLAKVLRQSYPGGEDVEVVVITRAQQQIMDAAAGLQAFGGLSL